MAAVIYNGKDIAADVEIGVLAVYDSCGDQVDALDAVFMDTRDQWSGWNPQKGDTLGVEQDGYRSGTMWIDRIRQDGGRLALGAVSLPPDGKTKRSKCWENITLMALAAEKAAAYGMSVEFYGVQAVPYARVDQIGRGDFGFLQERAQLEGCTMKVTDNRLVLYSDRYMESLPPAKAFTAAQFCRQPLFDNSAGKTYSSCTVSWGGVSGTAWASGVLGPDLTVSDVPVGSIGEARRFAENLLRAQNKHETAGEFSVLLDTSVTAGNTVAVTGMGLSDGKYFVELAVHDFSEMISTFTVHRCLEG